ncbi:hypothetical protein G5714_022217 [Onychostoma macrolepis]|uniref:Immunoglobulin V-set domain-containing protein n=1 Tax=Onychostoma macrolepis TaxID=369639 RepID=A0A7J6BMI8_9TELE|nr:hypothetical protein G5714_022217 [Onychostoma macrolepis]
MRTQRADHCPRPSARTGPTTKEWSEAESGSPSLYASWGANRQTCENEPEDPIIRYCSPEEKNRGCSAKESERFSIKIDTQGLSVTFVDARVSDEGCYVVSYIDVDDNAKEKLFNVTVHGVVRDSERVEVKSGEHVTLFVKTPGNVSKVKLQKSCENEPEDPIIRYCSPEEKNRGCSAKESERFSIKTDTQGLSVTFVDARVSDEGCYVVSYIDVDDNAKEKLFNVTVHG